MKAKTKCFFIGGPRDGTTEVVPGPPSSARGFKVTHGKGFGLFGEDYSFEEDEVWYDLMERREVSENYHLAFYRHRGLDPIVALFDLFEKAYSGYSYGKPTDSQAD